MTAWETCITAADRKQLQTEHASALLKAMMLDLGFAVRAASHVSNGSDSAEYAEVSANANVRMVDHLTADRPRSSIEWSDPTTVDEAG